MKRNNVLNEEFFRDGIEIESLSDYLSSIEYIKNNEENIGKVIAYRGQSKEYWSIKPSIFREGMLNFENELMREPLLKCPFDFDLKDKLDILAKNQHYGMCTRLLDLTENPLVALYFACKTHDEEIYDVEGEEKRIEPYGCVYYLIDYAKTPFDVNVLVKAELAMAEFPGEEETLRSVFEILRKNDLIDSKMLEKWSGGDGYTDFVNIIQANDIVKPKFTNDRIERQKGMFLLTGCYNFYKEQELMDSKIHRANHNLRDEFEKEFLYVKGENKRKILDELDACGINEFSLFPEFEHKLSYLKSIYLNKKTETEDFIENEIIGDYKISSKNKRISYSKIKDIYRAIGIGNKSEEFIDYIKSLSKITDWDKKNDVKSKIKLRIKRDMGKSDKYDDINVIINEIVRVIYSNY